MAQEIRSPFQTRTENEDEVKDLFDLLDARENPAQDDAASREIQGDDEDLDIEDALTFPHKKRAPTAVSPDDITDFDGDARTSGPNVDEAEGEYATYQNFVASMNQTDPDPNAGMDGEDFIEGTDMGRSPDMTGTVTGAVPGLGTHLPQDLGRDGFQIIEPEDLNDPRLSSSGSGDNDIDDPNRTGDLTGADGGALPDPNQIDDENDPMNQDEALLEDNLAHDGGRIPTDNPAPVTRDEALDATQRLH